MKFWVSPLSRRERDLTESAEPETLSSGVPRSARGAEGTGRYPGLPADLCCPAFCPPRFNFPRFVEQSLQQTALELESVLFKARPGESAPSFTMSPLGPGGGLPLLHDVTGVHRPRVSSAGLTPCSGVCVKLSDLQLFLVLCPWVCILSVRYRACLGGFW